MRLRSKETYWLLKNGLITSYPSLHQDITCDVLIIGGGITGSLMAYQLSKEGYKTVLVDKRDIGMGSTSATTAMIQYEIDEPLYSLIDKVGEHAAVDSYRAGVSVIDQLEMIVKSVNSDCSFTRKQSLFIAHSKKDLEWLIKEYETRKKFDFHVIWLTQDDLKTQFGVVGEGGILSKAGASMDAYRLTHDLLAFCIKNYRLSVYDHTAIEKVLYNPLSNIAFSDNKNTITCAKLIYASGYETHTIIKKKIVDLISTYAIVSEPLKIPAVMLNTLIWNTQDPYLYARTTSDNRILVGGGDVNFKNAIRRDRLLDQKELFLLESFQKLMPAIKIIPDFTWAGTFGVTKDALPYIGPHHDFPNTYFVLGFGGNGITFSTMAMSIISDAIKGESNKFLEYYRFNR